MRTNPLLAKAVSATFFVSSALVGISLCTSAAAQQNAATATRTAATVMKSNPSFDQLSKQFLNALWQESPEMAIGFGKFDNADRLTIPNQHSRDHFVAFAHKWLAKFAAIDASKLPAQQSGDLDLIQNFLRSSVWQETTFREFEWNPALKLETMLKLE